MWIAGEINSFSIILYEEKCFDYLFLINKLTSFGVNFEN